MDDKRHLNGDITMNILVVDDEIVQIETIQRGLRSKGYQVTHALNAEDALRKIRENHTQIDLVITDYAMPGMNGIGLLKKIRETRRTLEWWRQLFKPKG